MSSRRAEKDRRKAERLARERAEAEARRRRRRLVVAGGVTLSGLVAVGVVLAIAGGGSSGPTASAAASFPAGTVPPQRTTGLEAAARRGRCGVEDLQSEGAGHVEEDVTYRSNPPHSGDHAPAPAEDGAYVEPPALGASVHALEHGRIVIWYRPDLPARARGALKALFDEDPVHMLLVPAPEGMPFEVAASAWTHVLGCEGAGDGVFDAIRAFKERYRDQGPEFVP